tara:strand:+ start:21899 stop:22339 length:441 start_codon:yes stop_codon:yes gene_type:complete
MSTSTISNEFKKSVNEAIKNLYIQGESSELITQSGDARCAYRGKSGNKCIVGWMIPDEKYDEKLDLSADSGVIDLFHKDSELDSKDYFGFELSEKELQILFRLQGIHDQFFGEDVSKEVFRKRFLNALNEYVSDEGGEWIVLPESN